MHTQELIDTIRLLNETERRLKEVCELAIEASLNWTGEDEENNPPLKRLRTIAGIYLNESECF